MQKKKLINLGEHKQEKGFNETEDLKEIFVTLYVIREQKVKM